MPLFARLPALAATLVALPAALCADDGIVKELAIEGYNNEAIYTYSPSADFRKLGRGVGKLQIRTDAGENPCTAFLVDATHIMTNYHCIPGVLEDPRIGATEITSVTWIAGFVEPGRDEETARFAVNPVPVESSAELDYSVLEVTGVPIDRFPPLPLSSAPPVEGMPFWIIGHPMGKSQHISREGCRAARPPLEKAPESQSGQRVRHTCDTLGGNSGSPIIDSSARQVIALHNSGNRNVGINYGIPMAEIIGQSKVLKPGPLPAPKPQPMLMSAFPDSLGVGGELSLVADMPSDCTPAFVDISPSLQLTPIPLEIFEKVDLGPGQTRYQVTPTSQYAVVVQEQDEKGEHRIGYLCSSSGVSDAAELKSALRLVLADLNKGQLSGKVTLDGGTVDYAFKSYVIE
ncbi:MULTISPECIES: serine protease [unclassified Mameliella]|uniref:trypsin-like serine peptidase n=1 Tax=unclassified Mameliella TaxID=2630630 RepID=UPI00273F965B|nr:MULTISPECIES: serine protease [unclassified Mameliella]